MRALGKYVILVVAVMLTAASSVSLAVECTDPDLLGIVWSNGEFTEYGTGIIQGTIFIFNPTSPSISGYEMAFSFPDDVFVVEWNLRGQAVNVSQPPEFAVGLGSPLFPDADNRIALVDISVFVSNTNQADFFVGPTSTPSIPGEIVYADGDNPGLLIPMDPVSGSFELPIARLNGPALTWCQGSPNEPPVVSDIPDQTIAEGGIFAALNLDDYVADPDNLDSEISWVATGNVELGVSIVGNVATLTIPDPDWNGSETITFTATDPGGLSDSDFATFAVTPVNDPPVVSDIPDQTIDEGGSFILIDLDGYVTDPDNLDSEISWVATGHVELGVAIVGNVATLTIPDPDWNGSEIITFTATDPGGLSAFDAASFTVTPVNDAPIVADIPDQAIDEGGSFTTIILDNYVADIDNPDNEIVWAATGNVELGVAIVGNVATVTTPDPDWNGIETITFTATDPGGLSDFDAATFNVIPVNDPPVVSDIPDLEIAEGGSFTTINLDDYVDDIDNLDSEISWVATGNVELGVAIVGNVATLTIPDPDWNGSEVITFTATDPGGLSAFDAASFTVTPVNDAPIVADIPDQAIDEGGSFTTIILDNYVADIDNPDNEIVWAATGNVELGVAIVGNVATVTTPDPDWNGIETITFTATDPGGLSDFDAATFTVLAVNDPPLVSDIPDQEIAEGGSFTTINLNDYVDDIDNLDSEISWVATGNVELGVSIVGNVATVATPNLDWYGSETITFTASDPGGLSNFDAAIFTVTPVNDPPVVSDIPDQDIVEGGSFTTINLDDYVDDIDNLDSEISWGATGNVDLGVSIVGNVATVTAPNLDWYGSETITFTATDPGELSAFDTASFTVTPVNDAPIVADIPDQTIAEGGSFTTINLDDYVDDIDNLDSEINWVATGNVDLGVSIVGNVATVTIPNPDWNGSEPITFTATDPGGLSDSDIATFTVTSVNNPPVVSDIPDQDIAEGDSFTVINLDDYVTDPDDLDSEISWVATGNVELGVSIVDNVATLTIPDPDWNGSETITFTATDPGGLSDSDIATFTVTPVNDPPVVSDIPDQEIAEGGSFSTIDLDDYVDDIDNLDSEIYWVATGNVDLGVSIVDNVATLTIPDPDWNGSEIITFTATDPGELSDFDIATFTIIAVNDPPDAVDDNGIVDAGESVVIDVLTNDTDPETDPLTISNVTDGTHGTVTTDGSTVTYTHDGGDSTTDSFTYSIVDGNDGTDTATVTMTINQMLDFYVDIAALGDTDNRAGVMPGATDDYDAGIDQEEDPVGSHVWFPHPEWDAPEGPNFQWDIKEPYDLLDGLGIWNFVVEESNDTDSSVLVDMTFSSSFTSGDGIDLVLLDLETGEVVSLFPALQYSFTIPPYSTVSRAFELSIGQYGWTAEDTDGDGVPDLADACVGEDASFFDSDGDGCIDPVIGARHIEYWSLVDLPLTYVIHEGGAPGITDGSDFTAIEAGFMSWTMIPDVEVTVDYQGVTSQVDAQAMDLVNLVTFEDPDYVFPAGVLAVGLSTSFITTVYDGDDVYRPGQIIDSDLILNPAFSYQTSTMGDGIDTQSIVTHEAGHMLGISHSAVLTSTMSYVLRPNDDAASLSTEDELVMLKAYPDPAILGTTNHLRGTVTDGLTGEPVPGVIVFVMDAASDDTLGCDYTLPADGSYHFIGLPDGQYYVAIHPLDGSSAINFILPGNINQLIYDTAVTLVVPEYWDADESNDDNAEDMTALSIGDGETVFANIITNVDLTGPTVVAVTPASDAVDVAIDAAVAVQFSEPIDGSSLSGNFSLDVMGGGGLLPGNAALVEDGQTLVYVPVQSFEFDTTYLLEVGAGVQDLFGNSMGTPMASSFITEQQPPVSLANLVPRKGAAGSVVVINGDGFDPDPAQNEVSFGGTIIPVSQISLDQAVIEVPTDAVPSNVEITITNLTLSQTSNPLTFTVLEPEEIATGFEIATVDLFALPRTLEVSPDGDHVYIATTAGLSVVEVSDPGSPVHTSVAIDGGLNSLDVTPDGQHLFAIGSTSEKLYRFQADPVSLLNEISLGDVPRGVTLSLSGRRAFVAMDTDEIQIWDVEPGSATFELQVGSLTSPDPDPNFLGKMATDPAGNYLFALAGAGKLLVFDPVTETLLHDVPVMPNPRDVVLDPAGQLAYVTDRDGYLSVVSLTSFTNLLDIPTGGGLKGAAVTATGSFVWAANRQLNFLDVIDLRQSSPTYLTIATRIPQRVNPVDVGFSPDGIYAYSIVETEQKLVIMAKGTGPVLASLSRYAGPVDARVVLAGTGFTGATVSFNGMDATVENSSETSITAIVPSGATSGPVTVVGSVAGGGVQHPIVRSARRLSGGRPAPGRDDPARRSAAADGGYRGCRRW